MIDFGIVKPGTTLYIPFATYDSNDPSASVTLTGLATTDIEVYKNGSTTQRSSDSGFALLDTDGIDFDSVTGIHGFSIDLADNTDSGFYVAGAQYWVVVSSVTVDAATINFIAATFRIGYPDAVLNTTIATLASQTSFTLTAGPAEDDALNGRWCLIHDAASAVQVGWAQILDYTGSTRTVTLAAATTFTAAAGDNFALMGPMPLQPTVTARTLDIQATGEVDANVTLFGGNAATTSGGRPEVNTTHWGGTAVASATVNANATQISGDSTAADNLEAALDGTGGVTISAALTGNITGNLSGSVGSVTGAVGSVTGNVGGNVTGSVGSVAGGINTGSGVITTLDALDTAQDTQHGTTQTAIAALNDLSAAEVNAEIVDALAVDTYAEPSAVPSATDTLENKISWLAALARNKITQTATTQALRNDADSGNIATAAVSDDGTTFTRGEWA